MGDSTIASWAMLGLFLALCAGAALFGVNFRPGEWHAALNKPSWNPPNWVFGPVWTVLYVMIAVAGWLVWREAAMSAAMAFWAVQLVLNAVWSWLFFGLHRIELGLVDIVLLWLAIAGFVITAWPISVAAALLFLPYWAWVTFAGALNYAIMRLN